MEGLLLTKDSKLIETYWKYDEEIKEGSYKKREIENITPHILHEGYCSLEEGVTLKNIFEYMNKEKLPWQIFIGNWCEEFIEEILKEPTEKSDLHYLELYWSYEISKYQDNEACHFGYRMDFHGIGDTYEHGGNTYSLSFSQVNNLAHLPVKINEDVTLIETNYINYEDKRTTFGKQKPTLFQIIYSIIWELSFHGGPQKRDEESEKLKGIMDDLKNRYPEDFKEKIDV